MDPFAMVAVALQIALGVDDQERAAAALKGIEGRRLTYRRTPGPNRARSGHSSLKTSGRYRPQKRPLPSLSAKFRTETLAPRAKRRPAIANLSEVSGAAATAIGVRRNGVGISWAPVSSGPLGTAQIKRRVDEPAWRNVYGKLPSIRGLLRT